MIMFRSIVGESPAIAWWDNGANQIAFCRGVRGFIAFNNEAFDMNQRLFTCLPSGIYCDVATGQRDGLKCTGGLVMVDDNNMAHIHVSAEVGVLAIHIGVGGIYLKTLRLLSISHTYFNPSLIAGKAVNSS